MKTAVSFILGCLVATSVYAAPLKSADIASDAKWVMHADIQRLRQTELGRYILDKLSKDDAANKIAAFSTVFGFDPRKDVNSLTVYGKSDKPEDSVALLEGSINTDHLVTLLKANDTYKSSTYGKYTVHSWIDDKQPAEGRQYGCVHSSGKILISRGSQMLQEALDVLDGKHAAATASPLIDSALLGQGPFFMVSADLTDAAAKSPDKPWLQKVNSTRLGVSEKDGALHLDAIVDTQDSEAASNMQKTAQGFLAMITMSQADNPAVAKFAQALSFDVEGAVLHANLNMPVADLKAAIDEGIARAEARKAEAAAAAEAAAKEDQGTATTPVEEPATPQEKEEAPPAQ